MLEELLSRMGSASGEQSCAAQEGQVRQEQRLEQCLPWSFFHDNAKAGHFAIMNFIL